MSKENFLHDLNDLVHDLDSESHLDNPYYESAGGLISDEIDIALKNQRITEEEAKFYKNLSRGIIYKTPRQELGKSTTKIFNSLQENILGMENLMGLPQRSFAPAKYNETVQKYSEAMVIPYEDANQHLRDVGITPEFFINQMKKRNLLKRDLDDPGVAEFAALMAGDGVSDPLLGLPYPIYTQGEKEEQSLIKKHKKTITLGVLGVLGVSGGLAALGQMIQGDASHFFKNPGHIPVVLLAAKQGSLRDIDLGGIPDSWEEEHGLNKWNYRDDRLDFDRDGYTNLEEYILGLDPKNPDVDGDGLIDGGDPDHDGMRTWFEKNIADLDPLISNNRYVLLMSNIQNKKDSITNLLRSFIDLGLDEQYDFFNESMSIPEENIIELNGEELTYYNFLDACHLISEKSDENDLLYVAINGHGGALKAKPFDWGYFGLGSELEPGSRLYYDELFQNLDKIDSKIQYVQINTCYSGTALNSSSSGSVPRVVLTSCRSNEKIDGPSFTKNFYNIGLSKHIVRRVAPFSDFNVTDLIKYFSIPLPSKINPDKDKNHFISIKEMFESINNLSSPNEPQIYDPQNISKKFYFGEYIVRD